MLISRGWTLDVPAGEVHAIMGLNAGSRLSYALPGRLKQEATGRARSSGPGRTLLVRLRRAGGEVFLLARASDRDSWRLGADLSVCTAPERQERARARTEVSASLKLVRAAPTR
jgi:hypothetical protein